MSTSPITERNHFLEDRPHDYGAGPISFLQSRSLLWDGFKKRTTYNSVLPSPSPTILPHTAPTPTPTPEITSPAPQQPPRTQNQPVGTGSGAVDGTLTILVLLTVVFCFVWSPSILRRCDPRYAERRRRRAAQVAAARAAEEEAVRAIMEGNLPEDADGVGPHGMSLEDRRDFVSNVLVTKKVLSAAEKPTRLVRRKSNIMLSQHPPSGVTSSSRETQTIPPNDSADPDVQAACAICMEEYREGDEICWSHNERCLHAFHRECIIEWLIRHDDCPCCRHNFLSLDDDPEDDEMERDETSESPENDATVQHSSTGMVSVPFPVPPFSDDSSEEDTNAFRRGMSRFLQFTRDRGREQDGPAERTVEMTVAAGGGGSRDSADDRMANEVEDPDTESNEQVAPSESQSNQR